MCSKEGRGGTEGRPGSPTSTVDGTDNQPDPPKGKNLYTGIVNTCVWCISRNQKRCIETQGC